MAGIRIGAWVVFGMHRLNIERTNSLDGQLETQDDRSEKFRAKVIIKYGLLVIFFPDSLTPEIATFDWPHKLPKLS